MTHGTSGARWMTGRLRAGLTATAAAVLAGAVAVCPQASAAPTTAEHASSTSAPPVSSVTIDDEFACGAITYAHAPFRLVAGVPSDATSSGVVDVDFEVLDDARSSVYTRTASAAPGTSAVVPVDSLADGSFTARARIVTDPGTSTEQDGPWTETAPFVVDDTAPGTPSSVQSIQYPEYGFGEPTGRAPDGSIVGPNKGGFTVTVSADTVAVQYEWRGGAFPIAGCARRISRDDGGEVLASGGRVVIPVPAALPNNFYQLAVRAVDASGNVSAPTDRYSFLVAPYVAGATPGSDRLEAERLPLVTPVTTYVRRTTGSSRGADRVLVATRPGQRMTFQITAPTDGSYAIQLAGLAADHDGSVTVSLDGAPLLDPNTGDPQVVDFYRLASSHVEMSAGSSVNVTAGTHEVTLTTVAPNPRSRNVHDHGAFDHGNTIDLDFIRLVRLGDSMPGGCDPNSPRCNS